MSKPPPPQQSNQQQGGTSSYSNTSNFFVDERKGEVNELKQVDLAATIDRFIICIPKFFLVTASPQLKH